MSALLKIRSERDQMSAIERRIGDFVLDNAHLLRDYSSLQLANALEISQSSVVKFSQKLGFESYQGLKLAVSEANVRSRLPSTAVVVVSGYTSMADFGPDLTILGKPFRQHELVASVEAAVLASQSAAA